MTSPFKPTPFPSDFSKFFDVSKMMTDFKMPGVDMDAVMGSLRKNVEASSAANQLAFEGFQAFARRQSEMMRETIAETSRMINAMVVSGAKGEATDPSMAQQAEVIRATLEKSLANMRELSDMMTKANYEAVEVLSSRFTEGLEELRTLITTASSVTNTQDSSSSKTQK